MHRVVVAALLLVSTSPVLADSRNREDAEMARLADKLNDSRTQSAMSGMVVAMADVFMDLRVDKLRAAIARIDPDARDDRDADGARTLGDFVERDDPYFREKLANGSRAAIGTMGAVAGTMADMVPELRAMGERMGRDMEKAMKRMPRN